MYNLDKADRLLKRKLEKDPNYTKKLLEKIKQDNPDEFARATFESEYGAHLGDEDMYYDAVRNLKWVNGKGKGEKWDKDDLIQRSNLDFNEERFTPWDYAMAVNSHYADYGTISEDPKYYMDMAKNYLRNNSYDVRGDERAYYDAQMRERRNRYGYDNRRSYNNRYDGYGMYDNYGAYNRYDYDNRRYDERNTYRDRDNDKKYRE